MHFRPADTLAKLFEAIRLIGTTEPRLAILGFGPESLRGFSSPAFRYNLSLALNVLDALSAQGATVLWPLSEPCSPTSSAANDSIIDQANRDAVEVFLGRGGSQQIFLKYFFCFKKSRIRVKIEEKIGKPVKNTGKIK